MVFTAINFQQDAENTLSAKLLPKHMNIVFCPVLMN